MAASEPGSGRPLIAARVDDLRAETAELRRVLEPRPDRDWARPTPAAVHAGVVRVTVPAASAALITVSR